MPDAPTPPPAAASNDKPKRPHSANNQRIAAYITAAARFLQTARTDADIHPIVEAHGFTEPELEAGTALIKTAADAWGIRSEGMGEEDAAIEASDRLLRDARQAYVKFREIGRANFPDPSARVALGLGGDIAEGFNGFITQATASYTAGKKAPFTEKLSQRSYPPAALDALLADLAALTAAEADQTEAEGDAQGATGDRNEAYEALKKFMAEFKGTLRAALRGQPDLLAKLGL